MWDTTAFIEVWVLYRWFRESFDQFSFRSYQRFIGDLVTVCLLRFVYKKDMLLLNKYSIEVGGVTELVNKVILVIITSENCLRHAGICLCMLLLFLVVCSS